MKYLSSLYEKLSKLIHVQFLLQWYIVIFYGIYWNMSPIRFSSLEIRMKVLSPDYYNFKKLSVLSQTIRSLYNSVYFLKRFLNNFDSCLEYKSVSYTMVYTAYFEEVYLNIRNQSRCFYETSFLKVRLYCISNFSPTHKHVFVDLKTQGLFKFL